MPRPRPFTLVGSLCANSRSHWSPQCAHAAPNASIVSCHTRLTHSFCRVAIYHRGVQRVHGHEIMCTQRPKPSRLCPVPLHSGQSRCRHVGLSLSSCIGTQIGGASPVLVEVHLRLYPIYHLLQFCPTRRPLPLLATLPVPPNLHRCGNHQGLLLPPLTSGKPVGNLPLQAFH